MPRGSPGMPAHTGVVLQRHHVAVWAHIFAYLLNPSYFLGLSEHTYLHTCHVVALPCAYLHARPFPAPPPPMWWHGYACSGICHVSVLPCFSMGTPVWVRMSLDGGLDTPFHTPAMC